MEVAGQEGNEHLHLSWVNWGTFRVRWGLLIVVLSPEHPNTSLSNSSVSELLQQKNYIHLFQNIMVMWYSHFSNKLGLLRRMAGENSLHCGNLVS